MVENFVYKELFNFYLNGVKIMRIVIIFLMKFFKVDKM